MSDPVRERLAVIETTLEAHTEQLKHLCELVEKNGRQNNRELVRGIFLGLIAGGSGGAMAKVLQVFIGG